jgi:hypothetical protein
VEKFIPAFYGQVKANQISICVIFKDSTGIYLKSFQKDEASVPIEFQCEVRVCEMKVLQVHSVFNFYVQLAYIIKRNPVKQWASKRKRWEVILFFTYIKQQRVEDITVTLCVKGNPDKHKRGLLMSGSWPENDDATCSKRSGWFQERSMNNYKPEDLGFWSLWAMFRGSSRIPNFSKI